MKTGFLFFFVADHLLIGQLYTNPKSDRSLLSCLKVTQCSTSEIRNAPLYKSCSLLIQVMTTGALLAPSKWKPGWFNVPRSMKTKFPSTVMVFGVVSSKGHIMPPHIFDVGLKVNTKVYLDLLKSVLIPGCYQVAGGRPWAWQQNSAQAHKSKETQAWLQKECFNSHWPPPHPTWTLWTTSETQSNYIVHIKELLLTSSSFKDLSYSSLDHFVEFFRLMLHTNIVLLQVIYLELPENMHKVCCLPIGSDAILANQKVFSEMLGTSLFNCILAGFF